MMEDHINTTRTNFYEADFLDPLKSRRATKHEDSRLRSADRLPEIAAKRRAASKGIQALKQRNDHLSSLELRHGGTTPHKASRQSLNNSSRGGGTPQDKLNDSSFL